MRNTLLVTASVRSISENGIDAVPADENQFVKGEITKTNNPSHSRGAYRPNQGK